MQGRMTLTWWSKHPNTPPIGEEAELLIEFASFPVKGQIWQFTSQRDEDTDGIGGGMGFINNFETCPAGHYHVEIKSVIDGTTMQFTLEVEQ